MAAIVKYIELNMISLKAHDYIEWKVLIDKNFTSGVYIVVFYYIICILWNKYNDHIYYPQRMFKC